MLKIVFLGHATFIVETGAHRLMIDPFVSENPACPLKFEEVPKLTHVLITHGHGDHLGDAVEFAKRDGAMVICNFEISVYLTRKGVEKVHAMHIGGRYKFDFGNVKMVPALHGSGILENGEILYGGNPCGFLIEVDGKKVYHAGDTGLSIEMKLLEDEKVDLALLPIGGNYVMDVNDAVKAVEFIKPKLVVPMHYGTWPVISARADKFKDYVEEKGFHCSIIKPGDSIEL